VHLALIDRDMTALQASAKTLPDSAAPLLLAGDVGTEADVVAHVAAIHERHGSVDALLAATGISTGLAVMDCDLASWEVVLHTNLTGTFLWAREEVRVMREAGEGGSIILVGSQLAIAGGRGNAACLASKGAVASLARSMAMDHAVDGIRVNVVVPGAIATPLLERSFARAPDPTAARSRSLSRHPLGRFGRAEEVAKAVLFLASDDSLFTTGSCLMVDCG
jgi:NAD(P)-dependent dehydrogenase (short-subunit alcohol dehydrogenase family)